MLQIPSSLKDCSVGSRVTGNIKKEVPAHQIRFSYVYRKGAGIKTEQYSSVSQTLFLPWNLVRLSKRILKIVSSILCYIRNGLSKSFTQVWRNQLAVMRWTHGEFPFQMRGFYDWWFSYTLPFFWFILPLSLPFPLPFWGDSLCLPGWPHNSPRRPPGWPQILKRLTTSASCMLELKGCVTTPDIFSLQHFVIDGNGLYKLD